MKETVFRFGVFSISDRERVLRRNGIPAPLPPKAIGCLLVLLEADGRTVSKTELMQAVWPGTYVEEANLPQTISVLRKALAEGFADSSPIETIARVGYIFREPVTVEVQGDAQPPQPPAAVGGDPHPQAAGPPSSGSVRFAAAALALTLAAGLVLLLMHRYTLSHRPWLEGNLKTLSLTPGSGWELNPAISPDGTQLAYAARHDGDPSFAIYIKRLFSGDEGRRLDLGAGDCLKPAWARDGKRLAFVSFGRGSAALKVADLTNGGISVIDDKRPWVGPLGPHPVQPGGWDGGIWSNDGASLIFNSGTYNDGIHLVEQDLRTGRRLDLTPLRAAQFDGRAALSPDGRTIVFLRETASKASLQLLDLTSRKVRPLAESWSGSDGLSWSSDGSSIVSSGDSAGEGWSLWRIPASGGRPARLATQTPGAASDPAADPSGQVVAYTAFDKSANMMLVPAVGGTVQPRAIAPAREVGWAPSVSPDGRQLAYLSARSGEMEVWLSPVVDAPEERPQQLTHGLKIVRGDYITWSPDSRTLAVSAIAARRYILIVDVATGKFAQLQAPGLEGADLWGALWSEDGRWVYAFAGFSPRRQYRIATGPVPLAEPIPGLPREDAFYENLEWAYFTGDSGVGLYRQHFRTPGHENSQPELIPGLEAVVPGINWQAADGGLLFIDQHAAVQRLQRWDAKTGRISDLTGPLSRVDFDFDFSYVPSKHFVVYPQYRDAAGTQIYGLVPGR